KDLPSYVFKDNGLTRKDEGANPSLMPARRPSVKHPTIPPRLGPAEALRRHFAQAAGLPFADVLSAAQLQQVLTDCQVRFRDRVFAPLTTLATFLTQVLDADHSMPQSMARLIADRAAWGFAAGSPDARAYS